jgi:hypothetical protein
VTSPKTIHVEFDGDFSSHEEAARALQDAAWTVLEGGFIAAQPSGANHTLFVTDGSDDDDDQLVGIMP